MNKFSWLFAAALLSSCSQDWARGIGHTRSAADGPAAGLAAVPVGIARTAPKFAGAPDLGTLVQYPARATARRTGAYTWHPVGLSEDHALNAIVAGEMTVTAPDGRPIRLDYERHVEHADGNWTWIGRSRADADQTAVITFGETAAFGSIPQGRGEKPLRLTVSDGRPWLVSTDRDLLRRVDNEATDPTGPDYFIPPKLASASASGAAPTLASAPTAVVAGPTAASVVDVLVGYTSGYAASLGGQAAAQTRIRNLVEITNQSYVSSQVNAQVRLVGMMQVSYPDATDNGTALEEMTGFQAPSTETTPAPAFRALRAARDQYGADLVTLVRKFNTPENGGCGIAWLIGGNLQGINREDGFFGYSVVSDGRDRDTDGDSYFCRDETFAHELGHNMGSQHDAAAAGNKPGAYAYSYGYKAAPGAGNFHTIMAYGDVGQADYQRFSNPRISTCGGLACGVANADNARSLGLTLPIVASFRATLVPIGTPVANDFNGDGRSDVLWRNSNSGANTIWRSANSATQQAVTIVPVAAWKVAGVGDFNGDGVPDIVWRNSSTGSNTIWRSGNSATKQAVTAVPAGAWNIVGVGDFDGDGAADLLWRNSANGANTIWRSANAATKQLMVTVTGAWNVVGVGDFNGDGVSDVLWRNSANGFNTIWWSGNLATAQPVARVSNLAWKVAGVGDFNADGQSDIVWRNASTGANTIWRSGNAATPQAAATVGNLAWKIVATNDYDGDGRSDLFWRNSSTGANAVWRSGLASTPLPVTAVLSAAWVVQR